ncbi:MAG: phosphoesterase, partial [Candidatus Acidiferrales bacterium]
LEGYNKFIPYYLHPAAVYSVGVSASATRAKVSVGTNPWNPPTPQNDTNLATLCEKYGGGGHARVAAISLAPSDLPRARQVAREIAATLRSK